MGHFLDVAHKVLSEYKKPLSVQEIITIGTEKQLLHTDGKTPWQTMKSKLSTDILNKKERSLFMRTSTGKFGLRCWTDKPEYIAERFKKSLLDEDILVFPSSSLRKYVSGRGLHTMQLNTGKELIAECFPMSRRKAEEDYTVIQLVSSFVVRFNNCYLTYKRTKRLPESRLHSYYSIPLGGHLNPEDILPFFDFFDFENMNFMLTRELQEEIKLPKFELPNIVYKGLIFDDRTELGLQHVGIVYDVYLKSPNFQIAERGFLMDPKFETLSEIESRIEAFESWSIMIIEFERSQLTGNCNISNKKKGRR